MNIIIKESERLNKIITDFLNFTWERPLMIQKSNLVELFDEVVTLLKKIDKSKDVKIETYLSYSMDLTSSFCYNKHSFTQKIETELLLKDLLDHILLIQ